jgi:hypothetical protein
MLSATSVGDDMAPDMVRRTLDSVWNSGYITIGGGEPTIHSDFWEIFEIVVSHPKKKKVKIVTNGSMTDTALELGRLAKRGILRAGLSLDKYHNVIDPRVLEMYLNTKRNSLHDGRYVLAISDDKVTHLGRSSFGLQHICPADFRFIKPNGEVYSCVWGCCLFGRYSVMMRIRRLINLIVSFFKTTNCY